MRALLVLVALILASPAAAEWTWAGPDGGSVQSLALQPGSSSVLYAGAQGGVFKSLDGGATWLQPGSGMPSGLVLDIAVDPGRPATVYAALAREGLYKSSDAGAHWAYAGAALPGPPLQVAVTPGGVVYAGLDSGVFRSRDGGASWQAVNRGLPEGSRQTSALEIDPSRPARMLAGFTGSGIYRSTNGGARWSRAGGAAQDRIVLEIAFGPASSEIVYAATEAGVLLSLDSGATWSQSGLTSFTIAVAAHPTLPGTVYAGTPEGVFRSTDRGATWLRASDGLTDPAVRALEIDPVHPATLWAGTDSFTRLGGVFRTTDAGAHWGFRSNGLDTIHVASLAVDPHAPGTLFAALSSAGLARSRDRGLHWTPLPIPEGLSILDVEVDPVDSSVVYAAAGSGNGPLLKSTDGGDTWTRLGGPPTVLWELEIDPVDPSVLHGGSAIGFWKSTDAGATWVQSPSFPLVTPLQIEIAPGVLYAIARPPAGGTPVVSPTYMLRSTDAGQTWEVVLDVDQAPISLAVSPSAPETVHVLRRTGPILRSTDGGNTWETVGQLPGAVSLAIAAGSPETLLAAVSNQGIFASTDGGATWSLMGQGLAGLSLGEIAVDPHDPARPYVTVTNRGIATPYEPEECEPGPATLCLQGGRFRVEAVWTDFQGNSGSGQAIPMTDETGGLWFFDPANVELVVKVLDGRGSNGRFWVFAASLTSVEFTLTVTDVETGERKVYPNPPGHMASFGDTNTF